jgi:peptidylprolyl isomerase
MHKEKTSNMMIVWVLIVLLVIGILVYVTIHNKVSTSGTDTSTTDVSSQNTNMQPITQPTQQIPGVSITITQEGTGAVAKTGDTVAMNYTGTLADGTVFDSNVDPKFGHVQPFIFTIGAGMVIKGWDVGVAGMKVGEKRTLVIDPDYAYGASGAGGGAIPPNATLTFDVELVAIKQ